jgi:glutamate dehydrogenase/leucine dehydrogenase
VFVCAALSGSVTEHTLEALAATGVRVIACGANQPFREESIGDTRVTQMADSRFAVLADFLSNCGMARTFSYLMEPSPEPRDAPILEAIDSTIRSTLDEVLDRAEVPTRGLFASTLAVSLDRIATLD